MFRYWFGVYHWRRRLRRIGAGVAVALAGVALGTLVGTDAARILGLVLVFGGLWYGQPALKRLFVPAPWQADGWKYAPLRHALDLEDADRWLDVGSGTGRSLTGVATSGAGSDALSATRVTALDVFDSGVILGNAAGIAVRNAGAAGVDAEAVRGDATRLPVRTGSQDVVTACRVLHDLSRPDAEATVREARRALDGDGQFGVLELSATHEATDDPLGYWESMLEEGGFAVGASGEVSRGNSWYCYLVCTASDSAS
ncbi:class I SAM-dependent methyltransferase [Halorarum halophilum]|uniref:Class I SAM-dependent methyltransferase n=1 Tax=Halorarum halophilum TaxID=2743090 RepID=A0A7D5GK56_9EURY|nr:class I SAM-dependent methyltransferase [Halobaculum halophilum]QLG27244.1 class I SAM-dependent methyltransferase [Halobaculum halophilum]